MTASLISLLMVLLILVIVLVAIAHLGKPRLDKNYFRQHWSQVERQPNLVAAVISADALLDEALKRAHIKGNTMGERLKKAHGTLKSLNAAWSAHKVRNRIAHEPDNQPSEKECQQALRNFKRCLHELGAL